MSSLDPSSSPLVLVSPRGPRESQERVHRTCGPGGTCYASRLNQLATNLNLKQHHFSSLCRDRPALSLRPCFQEGYHLATDRLLDSKQEGTNAGASQENPNLEEIEPLQQTIKDLRSYCSVYSLSGPRAVPSGLLRVRV